MPLRTQKDGPVLVLTLDRPEAKNAFRYEELKALEEAWLSFDSDKALHVAILTGAGEEAFSAGIDLKNSGVPEGGERPKGIHKGLEISKPVICAINGLALGGGLELALACDIRLAAKHARMGLAEVKWGIIPGGGGAARLPRLVPAGWALEMLLTGDPVDAQTALRLGLVNHVLPLPELMSAARELAGRIATRAPLAVRAAREMVWKTVHLSLAEALAKEKELARVLLTTKDHAEGRAAFAEKRAPVFEGK